MKRVVVRDSGAQVQVRGELKVYGRSISTIEMGTAHAFQFEREHYREALRLAEREGAAAAASYLKARYPHIQENWVREALLPARGRYMGFAAESAALLLGGWALYSYYKRLRHPSLDWESYESHSAPLERKRWLANDDFESNRSGYALCEEYQGHLRFSFVVRRGLRSQASSGHFIVARLLEGCEGFGPLSAALRGKRAGSLREAVEGLDPRARRRLEKSFGTKGLEELLCISQERDREMFWASLQELARRQQERERYDSAASLYYLAQLGEGSPERKLRARRQLEECLMAGGKVVDEGFLRAA